MTTLGKIAWAELEGVTGLSDRRHRQLAKDGHFPAPDNGQYDLMAVIKGLLKFYRETHVSARTTLNDVKQENTVKKNRLLDLQIAKEERRMIPRADVDELLHHIGAMARTTLYQALETELPPRLDGMSASEIRPVTKAVADEICDAMKDIITRWKKDDRR